MDEQVDCKPVKAIADFLLGKHRSYLSGAFYGIRLAGYKADYVPTLAIINEDLMRKDIYTAPPSWQPLLDEFTGALEHHDYKEVAKLQIAELLDEEGLSLDDLKDVE